MKFLSASFFVCLGIIAQYWYASISDNSRNTLLSTKFPVILTDGTVPPMGNTVQIGMFEIYCGNGTDLNCKLPIKVWKVQQ